MTFICEHLQSYLPHTLNPKFARVLQNELCNKEIARIWHNCLVVFLGVTLSAVLGTLKNLYKT